MQPTRFKGWNVTYAEDQPAYLPLPAHRNGERDAENNFIDRTGNVTTCWKMTFLERLKVLFTGRVYLSQWTFHEALQPQRVTVENPLSVQEQESGRPLDWENKPQAVTQN